VIWDLSSSPYVDIAGARMLGEVQRELALRGAKLRLVEARADVRDLLRAEIGASVGEVSRRLSIDSAIVEAGFAVPSGGGISGSSQ
jgi:MFS superfamily sulfate permease-like transporter